MTFGSHMNALFVIKGEILFLYIRVLTYRSPMCQILVGVKDEVPNFWPSFCEDMQRKLHNLASHQPKPFAPTMLIMNSKASIKLSQAKNLLDVDSIQWLESAT